MVVCRLQAPASGTITGLNIYCGVNAGSPYLVPVVYADTTNGTGGTVNVGDPVGDLLGYGTSTVVSATYGWQTFGGLNVAVTAGASYYLGFMVGPTVNDVVNFARSVGGSGAVNQEMVQYTGTDYPVPPSTFGTPNDYNEMIVSIYSTYDGSPTPTPTPTPTPSPTGAYDYYMGISGSNYVISTSQSLNSPLKSSTSSSTAFNWLLGTSGYASSGGTVYVEAGSYTVDGVWNIHLNDISVTFDSGAILTAIAGLNYWMLLVGDESYPNNPAYGTHCTIIGGSFNGNSANQAHGSDPQGTPDLFTDYYGIGAIWLGGQYDLVQYATVYNCRMWGIWSASSYSGCNDCTIYDIGWNGFSTYQNSASGTVNEAFCTNCVVYACSDNGIDSQSQNTIFTGNYVYNCAPNEGQPAGSTNSYWGIAWEGSNSGDLTYGGTGSGTYAQCIGNTITNCLHDGVFLSDTGSNYIIVSGNVITGSAHYGIGVFSGGSDNIIEYNSLSDCSYVGIDICTSASLDNTIYGNTFSGCSTNTADSGTGTIYTQPSIVAVTVTSSPMAAGLVSANGSAGPAGSLSTSPYIFYATVGASVSLVANTVSEYTFESWSDAGAQTHNVTVPSSNVTYTATYS